MSVSVYEPTGIVHKVTVNIGDIRTITSIIHLTQYDDTLPTIAVKIMDGPQAYKIPESAQVSIRVGKPDGTGVYNPCLGVSSDHTTAYFAATEQMCAAGGKAFAVAEVTAGGTASTGVFVISIDDNPVNDSTIMSDTELGVIQSLVDEAKKAAETAAVDAAKAAAEEVKPQIESIVTGQVQPISEAVDELKRTKADAIVSSASGESLHVEDASDNVLDNLKIFGKATQDGTPSPDNPVPITVSGSDGSIVITFTGENLLFPPKDESRTSFGTTFTKNDGFVSVTGEATGINDYYILGEEGVYENIPYPTGEYTFSSDLMQQGLVFYVVEEGGNILVQIDISSEISKSIQIDNNKKYRIFYRAFYGAQNGFSGTYDIKVMMNKGDSALPWVPYKEPQTFTVFNPNGLSGVPVDSGGNYTDAKGQQWISNYKDYKLRKNFQCVKELVFDGSSDENWTPVVESNGNQYFRRVVPDGNVAQINPYFISTVGRIANTADLQNLGGLAYGYGFRFRSKEYNPAVKTVEEFCQYLSENPITVIVALITPIETDLSEEEISAYKALHTNKLVTNVYSDTDPHVGIQMDYAADTKTYVENLKTDIQELKAAVLLLQGGNE